MKEQKGDEEDSMNHETEDRADVQGPILYYCTWCREAFETPCDGPYCKVKEIVGDCREEAY